MKGQDTDRIHPVKNRAAGGLGWLGFGILLLGGLASRGLRFGGRFGLWAHWDEVRLALPALGMLQGDFPIHHLGVEYMGAFPSYLLAPWFLLFGSSPPALDCFAYGTGLALWGTGYLVARGFAGRRAAAGFALVSVVPTLLLNQWSLNGNLNYPFLLLLGNLLLLLTRLLFFTRNPAGSCFLATGFLAGLGWWNNLLILVYLLPIALLTLRTGLWLQKRFWLLPWGFLFGSLPVWLYELGHFPSARMAASRGGDAPIELGAKGLLLLTESLPRLLGWEPGALAGPGLAGLTVFLALWGGYSLYGVLRRDAGEMAWLIGLRTGPPAGRIILWGVLAANLALILATPRGGEIGGTGIRYLLPFYSVLPVWMGEALERLWARRRPLALAALAGWLGIQSWVNWRDTLGSVPAPERRWAAVTGRMAPLTVWLEERGLRRIYLEDPPGMTSYEFTFLTGGRIVAADPWREEYLPHAVLVDGADSPPFVTGRKTAGPGPWNQGLAGALKALGREPRIDRVGAFEVFRYQGAGMGSYEAVSPRKWRLSARPHAEAAGCMIDREAATGWTTDGPQEPGQEIVVDLGGRERLGRMDLWSPLWQDMPHSFQLVGSPDGRNWQTLAEVLDYRGPFFSAGPHPFLKVRRGRVQLVFPPRDLRYLRFIQKGRSAGHSWSVHEIHLYRPAGETGGHPSPAGIFSLLRQEGVRLFYADPWLSAGINRLSGGSIRTIPYNLYVNNYGRTEPAPERTAAMALQKGTALFLQKEADSQEVRDLLTGQGAAWKAVPTKGGTLIVFSNGVERDRPLPRENWRVTTQEGRETVTAVLDGKESTGWTPAGAGGEGQLLIDLGSPRPVQRLRVELEGLSGGGQPRLGLSEDGRRWERPAGLSWSGPVTFDGWGVVRNSAESWDVRFPSRRIRYLQLEFPPGGGRRGLEIREISIYE
jgi:hypothetical protein